jgi:hypothetical protein
MALLLKVCGFILAALLLAGWLLAKSYSLEDPEDGAPPDDDDDTGASWA